MWLNASLLFGVFGVVIPILIHLVKGKSVKKIPFAAMRFLTIAHVSNRKRIRLQDILLLLIRCAVVVLIALILARPTLKAGKSSLLNNAPILSVVVMDRSASMSASSGAGSRLQLADSLLSELLSTRPAGSKTAVILAADNAQDYIALPTSDFTFVLSKIRQAPLLDRGSDLFPAIDHAVKLLAERSDPVKELDVFTDGQASAFRQLSAIADLLKSHPDIHARFFIVGDTVSKNLSITSVRVEPGIQTVNQPFRVEVRVANHAAEPAASIPVSLSLNSDAPMDQGVIPSLNPGEERALWLFARMRTDGYHVLTARIPKDSMPADDQRSAGVRAVAQVRVLLVNGGPIARDRSSELFYLSNALRPVPRSAWEDYPVKLIEKSNTDLDSTRFEDFDVVVLANVPDLPSAIAARLQQFVETGGGLWIGAGNRLNPAFYNNIPFSPAALSSPAGDPADEDHSFKLSDRAVDHPILNIWSDSSSGSLASPKIFRYLKLTPAPDSKIVAKFSNDEPAIVERDVAQGRVILWSTTFNTAWNDLGARANVFVPLCQRTLGRLANRFDEKLTLAAGTPLSFPAPIEWMNKDVRISREKRPYADEDESSLSETRRVESVNGAPAILFDQTSCAGAYQVLSDSSNSSIRFAVTPNPEESILDPVSNESLQSLAPIAEIFKNDLASPKTLASSAAPRDLGFPLSILLILLTCAELFLSQRFSLPK